MFLFSPASPVRASTPDSSKVEHAWSKRYVAIGVRDIQHVVTFPARWHARDWKTFAFVSGGIIAVSFADKDIRSLSQRNRNQSTDKFARFMNSCGREVPFGIEGALYLGGELFHNERAKACGLDGLAASLISSGLVCQAVKAVVGRERPYNENGQYTFKPFTRHDSFPSGHTANAFALATVVSSHYHNTWIRIGAFSAAGLVAYARVNYDAHFASDVVTGAAIGFVVGKSVVALNRQLRKL
ncbi:MAG: phosphatase PAP2 family protein [Candidatus Zixiibacteriota bacterium]